MTNKPGAEKPPEGKTWRQVLEEHLAGPVPYLSAEEIVRRKREKAEKEREERLALARERNRKVLRLTPYGGPQRKWQPFVDKTSAYVHHETTNLDQLVEIRQAVARAAREARMKADPFGAGIWGADETVADVVRRQDETR
jgi:hypothetical protein